MNPCPFVFLSSPGLLKVGSNISEEDCVSSSNRAPEPLKPV